MATIHNIRSGSSIAFFYEYYSYFYGSIEKIQLLIEDTGGKKSTLNLNGVCKASLFNAIDANASSEKRAIYFQTGPKENIGILTIKDWHNDVLRKRFKQHFKRSIKPIFERIEKSNIEYLIIDLRDNQGGNLSNSKLVLSHLLNHPFEMIEKYHKIKQGKLVAASGPKMGIHKPNKYVFKGEVIVLINGGSFSNSGIFSSILKKYKRATFVGEETGGSAYLLSANSKKIKLPNTKIRYEVPTLQFVIKDKKQHYYSGVIPDYLIAPSIQNLINKKDTQMEYAIKLALK